MTSGHPIGVFDSGLGGLTILMACVRKMPDQHFQYLGDNANAPYGTREDAEIYALTQLGIQHLFDRGCRLVILACNTASAVALRRLQEEWVPPDRRVLGVFVPMIETLSGRDWGDKSPAREIETKHVALFATPATISSNAFDRELQLRASGVTVYGQACPSLVDALEQGDRLAAEAAAVGYVGDMLKVCPAPQAAVLGCTHYPILETSFARALPSGTQLISQPEIVAASLQNYLTRHPEFAGKGRGGVEYLTTGSTDVVRRGGRVFLGVDLHFGKA